MGGAENFGRIDGRLRMGFQPFDPRQLLVYGLLNDLFMAPLEVRALQRMPLERVLCQVLRQRGASVIVSYTLTNGVQFADELGWCDD